MKMTAIVLLIVVIIAAIIVGCAGVTLNPSNPKLGLYHYTHVPVFEEAPIREIPIWIDINFGEADKLAIDDAINAWNFAMNGYVKLKVVDTKFDMEIDKIVTQVNSGGWLFLKVDSKNKMVPINDKGYWTIGFCEQVGGHHMYLVRDRLGNDDVYGVTLHEIGHLMGSGHVGQRLMYPHYSRARFQCIDYDTMVKVSAFFDLELRNLNYCVDGEPVNSSQVPDGGPVLTNCPN